MLFRSEGWLLFSSLIDLNEDRMSPSVKKFAGNRGRHYTSKRSKTLHRIRNRVEMI